MSDKDPDHTDVPLGVFAASLHAYHDLAHLLTDEEADLLQVLIDSYVSRKKVLTLTLNAVKDVIQRLWQES